MNKDIELSNIIKSLCNIDTTGKIVAIESAKYNELESNDRNIDLYIKINGNIPVEIENYIADYNFLHRAEKNAFFLIADFIGPDESNGIPLWQSGNSIPGKVVSA